jgi:hypothetical protein
LRKQKRNFIDEKALILNKIKKNLAKFAKEIYAKNAKGTKIKAE